MALSSLSSVEALRSRDERRPVPAWRFQAALVPHESTETRPEPPPAQATYHDPVWLIECAWSRLRLASLQRLVGEVIADLRSSTLRASESPTPPDLEPGGRDPAVEALEACRAQLREACGMPGAADELARYSGVIRGHASARPSGWRTAFEAAFDQYRRAASRALRAALGTPLTIE